MVRTEGARLGLAHAVASEPDTASAIADERLIVQRRRSQDNPAPREHERRRTEDHREALDGPTQDHREARYGQAEDREARDREAEHSEACWPKDHGASPNGWAFDREAHDAPHLGPQEAPLSQAGS